MQNKFQEDFHSWTKTWCPKCKIANWLQNSTNMYGDDKEGCKCHSCSHEFYLGTEELLRDMYYSDFQDKGIEYVLKECVRYEDGLEIPN